MKIKTEMAKCTGCGQMFERRSGRSNPRCYCDREKCQKIKRIKNSVARFSDLAKRDAPGLHAEIRKYHGGYSE